MSSQNNFIKLVASAKSPFCRSVAQLALQQCDCDVDGFVGVTDVEEYMCVKISWLKTII